MSSRSPAPPLATTAGTICAASTHRCSLSEWPGSGFSPTAEPQYVAHLLRPREARMPRFTREHLFHIRPVGSLVEETHETGHELKRAVSSWQLTAMGVGAIIGTGIFVVIGEGAAIAGPAVILSFALAALACVFSALSYAELASSLPVSGSAYTYTYATLGEIVAWIIGWDLILEYGVSVAAVAVGWGGNFNVFLDSAFGVTLPAAISSAPEQGG